jgi:hypothetical protein
MVARADAREAGADNHDVEVFGLEMFRLPAGIHGRRLARKAVRKSTAKEKARTNSRGPCSDHSAVRTMPAFASIAQP